MTDKTKLSPMRPVVDAPIGPSLRTITALAVGVVVVAALYFGQEVLIPLALAVLIAFLLAPIVTALERLSVGRLTATLLVVVAALALVGGFGWIVEQRFVEIVGRMPEYRQSIQTKFHRLTS